MFLVKKLSAAPLLPDRPARPTLCAYCSTLPGMSQLTTCSRPVMSSPRPATSVATRHGVFPLLKSLSAASRFSCLSSPCSDPTFSPCRLSVSATNRTVLIRFANTSTRDLLRPSFSRRSVTCFKSLRAFLCSAHTCTVCSTSDAETPPPSFVFPPAATETFAAFERRPSFDDLSSASIFTIAGLGASQSFATARTVFGNVALNSSVCRPSRAPIPGPAAASEPLPAFAPPSASSRSFLGNAALIASSWSANPSASMRSASSSTNILARSNPNAPVSIVASTRPGVPTTTSAIELDRPSSSSCSSWFVPPYTATHRTGAARRSFPHTPATCAASSRVGARIAAEGRPRGADAGRGRSLASRIANSTAGRRYARVLPLPGGAMPRTSRPAQHGGQHSRWIGVVRLCPRERSASSK